MQPNNIGFKDSYRFESMCPRLYLPPHIASIHEDRAGGGELWDSSTGEDIGNKNEDNFHVQFADAKAGYYVVCDDNRNHRLISNPNLVIKKKTICRETGKVFYLSIYDAAAERKEYEEYHKESAN